MTHCFETCEIGEHRFAVALHAFQQLNSVDLIIARRAHEFGDTICAERHVCDVFGETFYGVLSIVLFWNLHIASKPRVLAHRLNHRARRLFM
jgi:hypothetical protein